MLQEPLLHGGCDRCGNDHHLCDRAPGCRVVQHGAYGYQFAHVEVDSRGVGPAPTDMPDAPPSRLDAAPVAKVKDQGSVHVDRCTLQIDCDRNIASVTFAVPIGFEYGEHAVRTRKSELVMALLAPRVRELMNMSKEQLMALQCQQLAEE